VQEPIKKKNRCKIFSVRKKKKIVEKFLVQEPIRKEKSLQNF